MKRHLLNRERIIASFLGSYKGKSNKDAESYIDCLEDTLSMLSPRISPDTILENIKSVDGSGNFWLHTKKKVAGNFALPIPTESLYNSISRPPYGTLNDAILSFIQCGYPLIGAYRYEDKKSRNAGRPFLVGFRPDNFLIKLDSIESALVGPNAIIALYRIDLGIEMPKLDEEAKRVKDSLKEFKHPT
ncbi:hypothetical protein HY638_04785 [Candidatus Woesearchaeota archaeon]|nr:hypothetical protein [Candidatus Woesearchaeota archaeon]